MTDTELPEGVTPEVADFITMRQPRCVVCGSTYALHIHHRVYRSEGETGVRRLLEEMFPIYRECYGREIASWSLHAVQNLIRVCNDCHEGPGKGIHGGNERLRRAIRHSFTSPISGQNIPFYRKPNALSASIRKHQYGDKEGGDKGSGIEEGGHEGKGTGQEGSGQEGSQGKALGVCHRSRTLSSDSAVTSNP